MSDELNRLLKKAACRSISDGQEILSAVSDFVNLPVSLLYPAGCDKKMTAGIIADCCDVSFDYIIQKKISNLIFLLSIPEAYESFWTEGESDVVRRINVWPNFLSYALATEIMKIKSVPAVDAFLSINIVSYLKCFKTFFEDGRQKEYMRHLNSFNHIEELYESEKHESFPEEITIRDAFELLFRISQKPWMPGTKLLDDYGEGIIMAQQAVNMLLIKLPEEVIYHMFSKSDKPCDPDKEVINNG